MPPRERWRRAREALLVAGALAVDLVVWAGDGALRWGGQLPLVVVPVLSSFVLCTLWWRSTRPVPVFAIQWVYSWAGLLVPGYEPFVGLLVAAYAVARWCPARTAVAALVAAALPLTLDGYDAAQLAAGAVGADFLASVLLWMALLLLTWGAARVARRGERRAEQHRREATAAAVQDERLRLARELHDIVSNAVSAMTLQAAGARTVVTPGDAVVADALAAIESTGVAALEELRQLLGVLRAVGDRGTPDQLPVVGLGRLDELVGAARHAGLDVQQVVEGEPVDLDQSVGVAAYRVVQEGLSNTARHAGRGASCQVHLVWSADCLVVEVRDRDGAWEAGRPHLSTGHGLAGLSERVLLAGGTLESHPVAGGFVVRAVLPTTAAADG